MFDSRFLKRFCCRTFTYESSCVRDKPQVLYKWLTTEQRGFKSVKCLADYWGNPRGTSPLSSRACSLTSVTHCFVCTSAVSVCAPAPWHSVFWSNSIEALIDSAFHTSVALDWCTSSVNVTWLCDSVILTRQNAFVRGAHWKRGLWTKTN